MDVQNEFEKLVKSEPEDVVFEELKVVALAIWYQSFTPNVSFVSTQHQARMTCYLLERLIRFNCVNSERYDELEEVIRTLESQVTIEPVETQCVSKAARRWGLKSDLKQLFIELLPYQTRHVRRRFSDRYDNQ